MFLRPQENAEETKGGDGISFNAQRTSGKIQLLMTQKSRSQSKKGTVAIENRLYQLEFWIMKVNMKIPFCLQFFSLKANRMLGFLKSLKVFDEGKGIYSVTNLPERLLSGSKTSKHFREHTKKNPSFDHLKPILIYGRETTVFVLRLTFSK